MDRRNFLSTLIGGVAATAAVRTFPFRVFSFPKEITIYPPLEFSVPIGVAVWASPIGGPYRLVDEISLAEAKARYGYEWNAGNSKTQRANSDHRIYCAPLGIATTTGLIKPPSL